MYAHARVVNIFKEGNYRGKIGVVHSLEPKYPYSDKPEDIHAAKVDEALSVRFLLDATYLGSIVLQLGILFRKYSIKIICLFQLIAMIL